MSDLLGQARQLQRRRRGCSYEEAAKMTGFTRSTVATYLMQARARLRVLLAEQDVAQ